MIALNDGWFLTITGPYLEVETYRVVALLGSMEVVVCDGERFGVDTGGDAVMRVLWHESEVTRREVEVRLRSRRRALLDGFHDALARALLAAGDDGVPWPMPFPAAGDQPWAGAALDTLIADGVAVVQYDHAGQVDRVLPNREQNKETRRDQP